MKLTKKKSEKISSKFEEYRSAMIEEPEKYIIKENHLGYEVITQYGFEGVRLWLRLKYYNFLGYTILFQPGQIPKDCPWQISQGYDARSEITKIFKPIIDRAPKSVSLFKDCCKLIFPLRYENKWYLLYFFDISKINQRNRKFNLWIGGEPDPSPVISQLALERNWKIPDALLVLYSIHNGFGPFQDPAVIWASENIFTADKLYPLSYISTDAGRHSYNPADLLKFYRDGADNGQFFYRKLQGETHPVTVSWDHENWEIYNTQSFFRFFENFIEYEFINS
ncbi:MAG: hypothetical protein HUU57_14560 [Bdellovibrio sp.]|nr:hypothetical protein [Bdellovibrio sp.]